MWKNNEWISNTNKSKLDKKMWTGGNDEVFQKSTLRLNKKGNQNFWKQRKASKLVRNWGGASEEEWSRKKYREKTKKNKKKQRYK